MANLMSRAYSHQLHDLRVHGNQVHAKRSSGQRLGRDNLCVEQFRRHRSAGNHPETACVGNGRDQVPLGNPGHCAAHDRHLATQKFGATLHEVGEFCHSASNP